MNFGASQSKCNFQNLIIKISDKHIYINFYVQFNNYNNIISITY